MAELLWYYCSPVYGSPTWWIWDLILLWLCPFCHLSAASCLWTWGIFVWWVPASSCWWLFNSYLQFWCSHRRRWTPILLLHHLQLEAWNFFHFSVYHPYIFLEASKPFFHFLWEKLYFFTIEFWVIYVFWICKSFIRYMTYKYFLPVTYLFILLTIKSRRCWFWLSLVYQFLFILWFMLLVLWLRNLCITQCHKNFHHFLLENL